MPRAKGTATKSTTAAGKPPPKKRVRKTLGAKPGKVSWIHGTKEKFFVSRADEWKAASEQGRDEVARFYEKVTNLYFLKYGHEMKDDEDLETDVADPTNPDVPIPGSENLTQEEAAARSEHQIAVRKASSLFLFLGNEINIISFRQRVAAWYCRTYRRVDEREKHMFADVLLGGLENTGPGCPRKAQLIHYYSRHHYEGKVKERFDAAWAKELQQAIDLGEPEPHDMKIKIRNAVTKEVFGEETAEFKAELALAVEAEHVAAVKAWELTRAETPARTAEEMNAALKNAAFYLDPLAEAIKEKFGLNCSILLCGPMGDRGGAIEVRSVHAGTTRGVGAHKWYQLDPIGYEAAEKSMIKFTERCFTEEECIARTQGVPQTAAAPEGSLTVGASTPGGPPNASAATGPRTNGAVRTAGIPASTTTNGDAGGAGMGTRGEPTGRNSARGNMDVGPESGRNAAQQSRVGGGAGSGDTEMPQDNVDGEGEGDGGLEGDGGGSDNDGPVLHDVWRQTGDSTADWTPECRKAFGAFTTGKDELGTDWGNCVRAWLEVEKASGFDNDGGQLTTEHRPKELKDFMKQGRRWYVPVKLSEARLGRKDLERSYVAQWWEWWGEIEGGERVKLATMHGLGFMLVLLSLLWWGAADHGDEWKEAVKVTTELLREVLATGKIKEKQRPVVKVAEKRKQRGGVQDQEDYDDEEEGSGEDNDEHRGRGRKRRKKGAAPAAEERRIVLFGVAKFKAESYRTMDLYETK
ncbi:hypothetical protein C8F04DRAFT_1276130 [Mycena alexandri]|uniref:Uncharacterized protein n=1 Tax=Mycena alexandri TaxID=1745969 RepID=A0AAD6S257_9AGAR|nr:hypothetical protein C8F04DRAFT_1276130 [Mycena alexandri]